MTSTRYAWTVVFLLWVAFAINYVDRQVYFSILPALRADLRFSEMQLGLAGSVFSWVSALVMPFAGRMADVLRRERMVVISLVLWSVATLATGQSRSPEMFVFWRGVLGVTESLYFPAAVALIAYLHPGSTRSKALSIHQSAQLAGSVGGGWYGGWAADHMGWRTGFGVIAFVGIVYAFVLYFAFRKFRSRTVAPGKPSDLWALLSNKCYLALSLAFFAFCSSLWIIYAWLPDFLYHRYHLSMTDAGLIATLYVQASCAVGVLAGGSVADRLSRQFGPARFYVVATGLILSAPFAYLMFAVQSLALLKIVAALFGFFAGFLVGNIFASAYDVIPERNYGAGAGILNTIGGISGGAGILIVGIWKAAAGYEALVGWASAATAAGGIFLLFVVGRSFTADRARAILAAGTPNVSGTVPVTEGQERSA